MAIVFGPQHSCAVYLHCLCFLATDDIRKEDHRQFTYQIPLICEIGVGRIFVFFGGSGDGCGRVDGRL